MSSLPHRTLWRQITTQDVNSHAPATAGYPEVRLARCCLLVLVLRRRLHPDPGSVRADKALAVAGGGEMQTLSNRPRHLAAADADKTARSRSNAKSRTFAVRYRQSHRHTPHIPSFSGAADFLPKSTISALVEAEDRTAAWKHPPAESRVQHPALPGGTRPAVPEPSCRVNRTPTAGCSSTIELPSMPRSKRRFADAAATRKAETTTSLGKDDAIPALVRQQ